MPIPTGDLLDTKQTAALLGVHEITLVIWRRERRGPPYIAGKDVRLILYRRADIEKWLEENLVRTDERAQAPASDRSSAFPTIEERVGGVVSQCKGSHHAS